MADLWPCYSIDHFGADIGVEGEGHPRYCLIAALSGAMELVGGPGGTAEAHGTTGYVVRALPGTRSLTSDGSARLVIWMDAARLERTLQARLGEPPREMLAFAPGVDWSSGQGQVVWRMIMYLMEELRDPHGLINEPIARETFTDLFLQTILSRLKHNYTERLERSRDTAIPRYVQRAEHSCVPRPTTRSPCPRSPPQPDAERQRCMPHFDGSGTRRRWLRCTACGCSWCARHGDSRPLRLPEASRDASGSPILPALSPHMAKHLASRQMKRQGGAERQIGHNRCYAVVASATGCDVV